MAERWVEIRLGGYLKQFGKTHRFLVSKSSEAIKALCKQVPKVKEAMEKAHLRGIRFAVFNGKHNVKDPEELKLGTKSNLYILPVYEGSKKSGVFQTILGAVLVAVSFIPGFQALAPIGIALLAGGVSQLLAPQQKGLSMREDPDNSASYAFGGPVNTDAQGSPIGVLYGEREVGGAIISASILAEDQA